MAPVDTQTVIIELRVMQRSAVHSARVRIGTSEYEVEAPNNLAMEAQEDMRLLKWKAAGLSDPGDMLLVHVGASLSRVIFPQEKRPEWESLLADAPKLVTVRFPAGAEGLFHIPWELLSLENRFLLRSPGSHLVREWGTAGPSPLAASAALTVLYASFAVDDTIDFQEERSRIKNALPPGIPVTFLPNPSREELLSTLEMLHPSIVHVAAHGYFDELAGNHILLTGWEESPKLAQMLEIVSTGHPRLAIFGTCEAGRLSTTFGTLEVERVAPDDLTAFSYPVLNDTALGITSSLYRSLGEGTSILEAAAQARGLISSDPYSFFNLAHYHKIGRNYFAPEASSGGVRESGVRSLSLVGREKELHTLNESAPRGQVTTIISPIGYGGTTLAKVWAWLHERSPVARATYLPPPGEEGFNSYLARLPQVNKSAITYLVLDDETGQSARAQLPKQHVIRVVPPAVYEPISGERIIVLTQLGDEAASQLAATRLGKDGDPDAILRHDLRGVPGFISCAADDPAHSLEEAEKAIVQANSMQARFAKLNVDGKRVAGHLVATRGRMAVATSATSSDDSFSLIPLHQMDRGVENLLAARVAFRVGKEVVLSPEFLDLGDTWFPEWGEENRPLLRQLALCLYKISEGRSLSEEQVFHARNLFWWAAHIRDWQVAMLLVELLAPWFESRGRLHELKQEMRVTKDKVDGLNRMIVAGNLGYILVHEGNYRDALMIHQEAEDWVRAHPSIEQYHRNLAAALTAQIDCYLALGMPADAERKIAQVVSLIDDWKGEMAEEGKSRVLAQIGNALSYRGRSEAALDVFGKAIELADAVGQPALQTKARLALGLELFKLERYDEAEAVVDEGSKIIPSMEDAQEIHPKYLDLKGQLLMTKNSPDAIKYMLESYELDRRRDDPKGITTSLLHLATWYFQHGQTGKALERLVEADEYVSRGGFLEDAGKIAHLRGRIYLAVDERSKARRYFLRAARLEAAAGHDRLAAEDNELAATCGS